MRRIMTAVLALAMTASPVMAEVPYEIGATAGLMVSDWDVDGISNADIDGESGFLAGVTFYKQFSAFKLRAGGYYAVRKAEVTTAINTIGADLEIATVDVPITALFELGSGFGLFAGPMFSLKVTDDCDGAAIICNNWDPDTFMTHLQFGVSAKVHPNWAVEGFYNVALTEVSDDITVNTAGVQAAFIY